MSDPQLLQLPLAMAVIAVMCFLLMWITALIKGRQPDHRPGEHQCQACGEWGGTLPVSITKYADKFTKKFPGKPLDLHFHVESCLRPLLEEGDR